MAANSQTKMPTVNAGWPNVSAQSLPTVKKMTVVAAPTSTGASARNSARKEFDDFAMKRAQAPKLRPTVADGRQLTRRIACGRTFLSPPPFAGRGKGRATPSRTAFYLRTYFCTRQFSVSATKISSRGLTAM